MALVGRNDGRHFVLCTEIKRRAARDNVNEKGDKIRSMTHNVKDIIHKSRTADTHTRAESWDYCHHNCSVLY